MCDLGDLEYVDVDVPIAGPSGLQRESAESDRVSESEPESSSGSGEGSEHDESEDEQEQIQLQPAENEIEGDFDRLIDSIRKSDSQQGSGLLSQAWDLSVNDEDDWRDELREASGVGRRKRKGRKRNTGPVLSQQVKGMVGEGNQAYVDGRVQDAIRIMQEVIRIEPKAISAWAVLANCQADMGLHDKALQLRIMAAHLKHDPERWYELAQQSRDMGFSKQALYCYSKAYSLDPTNVDALWDRAILAKELGQINTARTALSAILRQIPHDLNVLEELRPILIEGNKIDVCASLHQDAFEHYQELYPTGVGVDPDTGQEIPGGGFDLMHILVLADSYNTIKKYHNAITTIRRGSRWLQGRGSQSYWDACEDDREFDIVGTAVIRSGTVAPGVYELDINARHRLAISRIKMGDIEEGQMHAGVILAQDIREYAPLFSEIADAYYDQRMYAAAVATYEELGQDPTTSSIYVLERAAACRRMNGDLESSAAIYEQVIAADPDNDDAKRRLAEVYEILGETRKALNLVNQVIDARGRRGARHSKQGTVVSHSNVQGASLFEETPSSRPAKGYKSSKSSRPIARELEVEKEKEVSKGYQRVIDLTPAMKAGNEVAVKEWLLEAEKLIETFRETRRLFLATRSHGFQGMFKTKRNAEENEDDMASRLQIEMDREKGTSSKRYQNLVDVFRGVSFDNWLQLTMEYSFLLIRRDQHGLADEVLRHMLFSNAYQNRRAQDTLRLALITCAIHARDYKAVVEHGRKIIFTYQFNNEPIRILLAALASGHRQLDAFVASAFQKAMLREVRFSDLALSHPEQIKWNSPKRRFFNSVAAPKNEYDDEGEGEDDTSADPNQMQVDAPSLPKKPNPLLVTMYGQSCTSYQSAIYYLLQAYENCPEDPVVCMSLAITSLSRAMQRQADNRHHMIAQGLAFMSQYRKICAQDPDDAQEVEYNFGRLFHQIGLFSHAARHYEKALEIAERRVGIALAGRGVEKETAYNLSMIYVTTGANVLARNLYQRWLSI